MRPIKPARPSPGKGIMTNLEELELKNDKALIAFWEAVKEVDRCKKRLQQFVLTAQLNVAEFNFNKAQEAMGEARMAYLKAKVEAQEKK